MLPSRSIGVPRSLYASVGVGISFILHCVSLSVIWRFPAWVVVCRVLVPGLSVYQLKIEYLHFGSSSFPPIAYNSVSQSFDVELYNYYLS